MCDILSYFLYFYKYPLGCLLFIVTAQLESLIFPYVSEAFLYGKICFFSGCPEECERTQALRIPGKRSADGDKNAIVCRCQSLKL